MSAAPLMPGPGVLLSLCAPQGYSARAGDKQVYEWKTVWLSLARQREFGQAYVASAQYRRSPRHSGVLSLPLALLFPCFTSVNQLFDEPAVILTVHRLAADFSLST